jgi:hypothetical protein
MKIKAEISKEKKKTKLCKKRRQGTCARDCAIKYPTHASPCATRQR